MIATCEEFAAENNQKFSTDPDPKKSKTSAVHLDHELHQLGTMEHDAKVRRTILIENSTNIKDMFGFAHHTQVLQAVNVYAAHFY